MLPKNDVKKILFKGKELYGRMSIQTNGTLIDDDFIKIFKEANVGVGLSYDGPGKLSKFRFYGNFKNTLDEKIEKMIKIGIPVSIIVVLSQANAGTDKLLSQFKSWLLQLNKMKISGRINPCGDAPECELSLKRITEVYLDLADFSLRNGLRWSPFTDVINALQAKDRVCIFSGCDFYHTPSAAELLGDGEVTNCMRNNKEEIYLRYPVKYDLRKQILPQVPQENGGCKDCKYWTACYGSCSGLGINGDWRNKCYLCPVWKELFKFYEKVLISCNLPIILGEAAEKANQCSCKRQHGDVPHGDSFLHKKNSRWNNPRVEGGRK
jgi:uncharacterized protein